MAFVDNLVLHHDHVFHFYRFISGLGSQKESRGSNRVQIENFDVVQHVKSLHIDNGSTPDVCISFEMSANF